MGMDNFNRIKEVLVKKGKTNKALAEYLKVKPPTVSAWCTNTNQPSIQTLFKISKFLEVEASELLTQTKDLRSVQRKSTAKKK